MWKEISNILCSRKDNAPTLCFPKSLTNARGAPFHPPKSWIYFPFTLAGSVAGIYSRFSPPPQPHKRPQLLSLFLFPSRGREQGKSDRMKTACSLSRSAADNGFIYSTSFFYLFLLLLRLDGSFWFSSSQRELVTMMGPKSPHPPKGQDGGRARGLSLARSTVM